MPELAVTAGSVPEEPAGSAVAVLAKERTVLESTLTLPSGMVTVLQGTTSVMVTVSVVAKAEEAVGEDVMAPNVPGGREKMRDDVLQQATFALMPFSQQ